MFRSVLAHRTTKASSPRRKLSVFALSSETDIVESDRFCCNRRFHVGCSFLYLPKTALRLGTFKPTLLVLALICLKETSSNTRAIGAMKLRWLLSENVNDLKRFGSEGVTCMSDLVVIAFPTEAKAEEVRQKLLAMQKEYLIELGDAVIAVKDAQRRIKLNQLINTTAVGAVSGAFWGSLIGLIFLMPLAGAAIGAASGTLGGYLSDIGIDDKWMKDIAAAIQPGTAALFVLVRKVTADKVLEGLKGEGGTVMKTSLDHTKEAALQAALAGVKAAVPASSS
jgi:uncharacterized membrane protein